MCFGLGCVSKVILLANGSRFAYQTTIVTTLLRYCFSLTTSWKKFCQQVFAKCLRECEWVKHTFMLCYESSIELSWVESWRQHGVWQVRRKPGSYLIFIVTKECSERVSRERHPRSHRSRVGQLRSRRGNHSAKLRWSRHVFHAEHITMPLGHDSTQVELGPARFDKSGRKPIGIRSGPSMTYAN